MIINSLRFYRKIIFLQFQIGSTEIIKLSFLNKIVTTLIFISVLTTVLETEVSIRNVIPSVFYTLNFIFIILFTIEYILRLWVCKESILYKGKFGRLKYIFSVWSIIDLIAIIPFIFALGSSDTLLLRILRVLRLITLFKLGKYSKALKNIIDAFSSKKYELIWSIGIALFVMFTSAVFLYLIESKHNPEYFGSILRSLWWGAATITKIGYGGAFPITILGKICAVIFAIAAVGVVAVPTGIIAGAFYEVFSKDKS